MFHSFDIVIDDAFVEAEQLEKIGQELVSPRDVASKRFAGRRSERGRDTFRI